ncbi:MAG: hypothetical protein NTY14_07350 [Candidatus Omnitrophica bacterium]|nr:hypothetical protein [Candidatus Omnitrophota bacterium]
MAVLLGAWETLAEKSIELFFVGLAVNPDNLWVNLNPEQPGKIIGPAIKDTDLGKIILAADLRLKKDVAAATNPRTSEAGRIYWDKLYAKAEELGLEDKIPVANRVWIIPDIARVRESANATKIVDAPLKVCLESEYVGGQSALKDRRQIELADYANRLLRELILPAVTRKINEQAVYADLRQVYRALVLVQCYKNKSYAGADQFLRNAATVLEDAVPALSFSPEQIYGEYMRSLKKGEYNFSESKDGQLGFYLNVITRDYFSGGVDLSNIKTVSTQETKDRASGKFYSATIVLPKRGRILQVVRNNLELKVKELTGVIRDALVENLPVLTSQRVKEPSLLAQEKFSRAVLSNL